MNKTRPTLLFLIPGFAADETDTTCVPSQQLLVLELNRQYPALQIIILAFQYPFIEKEYQWHGNRVIPFNGQDKPKLRRLMVWKNVYRKLQQLKKENNVTGIFSCWCTECALVGALFSKRYSLKHFIWICGQDAKKTNRLVKFIRPKPNSLIAISDFLASSFYKNHGILPSHIIPVGIDTTMYTDKSNIIDRSIDLIGVGSLIPLKQYEIFIAIICILKQKIPGVKAMICGNGKEKEKLQHLIAVNGLEHNILLTGSKPHHDIIQLMQESKILLHPSSYEGFGAVCIEALYAGAHVISFCKPMNKDFLQWHIVNSTEEMANKAFEILTNRDTAYNRELVNDIKSSATAIAGLYDYP